MDDDDQLLPGPSPSKKISNVEVLRNSLSITSNIGSAVGVVVVNKIIFQKFHYPYGVFLTVIHFVVTSAILFGLGKAGLFETKKLPIKPIILLSLSFCGFVVLTNLSLKVNSVAFYQMAKVLTTPFVGLIQYYVYGIGMRWSVRITLGVACIGVLLATFEEVKVSVLGTTLAMVSVWVTAIYQVLVGAKQKELEANSLQLLSYQAPISAVLLFLSCPFLENVKEIIHFQYSTGLILTILLSSILAAMVNVSTFLIIGHTSAITYNVVGHCKLSLVLLCGFLFFNDARMGWVNIAGVLVALFGIVTYSFVVIYHK